MSYSPGDHVHVRTLGKGVVREVRNGGRYLVELKGRSVVVKDDQLEPVVAQRRAGGTDAPSTGVPDALARAHAASSLDLHGMTVEEAVVALDAFLDDAIRAGLAEVTVIHGRSGGKLRAAVHQRLKGISAVASFRLDERNPGVTKVRL